MLDSIPVRVITWLPKGTMVAMGAEGETPDNWIDMDDWEKMNWCILHNAQVLISPDVWKALHDEAVERTMYKL